MRASRLQTRRKHDGSTTRVSNNSCLVALHRLVPERASPGLVKFCFCFCTCEATNGRNRKSNSVVPVTLFACWNPEQLREVIDRDPAGVRTENLDRLSMNFLKLFFRHAIQTDEGACRARIKMDSPEAHERVLREARSAAVVNQPNSVYVYGTEEIDGSPVISMEFVPDGTLDDRVRARGRLQARRVVESTPRNSTPRSKGAQPRTVVTRFREYSSLQ